MKEHVFLDSKAEKLLKKLVKAKAKGVLTCPDTAIANLFGISISKVSNIRRRPNTGADTRKTRKGLKGKVRAIDTKVQDKIRALTLAGKGPMDIMKATKVSYATAQRYRSRFLKEGVAKVTA
jgi:transposase